MGNSNSFGSFKATLYGYNTRTYNREPCAECNDKGKYEHFSCDACKHRPYPVEKVPARPKYELIKDEHGVLLLQRAGFAKWDLKNFSQISFEECGTEEGVIQLVVKPEKKLYHTRWITQRKQMPSLSFVDERVRNKYRLVGISLRVSAEESRKLEEELSKPEYGLNVLPKKADDRVVPKKTESRDLKVLQSILDEAGIPDAGHRRLAAPSPVTIEAPDTSSFTAYTLLFSGILFAGFLLTKCLRKRNRHRRSFTREDEGAL